MAIKSKSRKKVFPINPNYKPEWNDGEQREDQLDDVIAERLELVPHLRGLVCVVRYGIRVWLSLVEVIHAYVEKTFVLIVF